MVKSVCATWNFRASKLRPALIFRVTTFAVTVLSREVLSNFFVFFKLRRFNYIEFRWSLWILTCLSIQQSLDECESCKLFPRLKCKLILNKILSNFRNDMIGWNRLLTHNVSEREFLSTHWINGVYAWK